MNPDQASPLRQVNGKRNKLSDMTTNYMFSLSEVKQHVSYYKPNKKKPHLLNV